MSALAFIFAALIAAAPSGEKGASDSVCTQYLTNCRDLLVAGHDTRAELCLREFLVDCSAHESAHVAEAMLEVAEALAAASPVAASPAVEESFWGPPRLRGGQLSELFLSGQPELVLVSTLYGAGAGFFASAAALTADRATRRDSFVPLVAATGLGAGLGLLTSGGLIVEGEISKGQMALVSSALLVGSGWGLGVGVIAERWAIEDDKRLHEQTAARFAATLAGGLAASSLALGLAPLDVVDPGDVGVMNSAAIWGALLAVLAAGAAGSEPVEGARAPAIALIGSVLAYDAALLASPLIQLPRPSTWFIDGGAFAGLLVSFFVDSAMQRGRDSRQSSATFAAGLGIGIAGGAVLAAASGEAVARVEGQLGAAALPKISLFYLPDAHGLERPPVLGLSVGL